MNKARVTVLLLFVVLLFMAPGCGSTSSPERTFELPYADRNGQEKAIWIEEIRQENGVDVMGYLKKVRIPVEETGEDEAVYFVYDRNLNDVAEGMILDRGTSFEHAGDGSWEEIGLTGIEEGVKRILGYKGDVQFFRNGRQTFHDQE